MAKNKEQTADKLTDRQRQFLDIFINSALGNVSAAAKAAGIRRETFYLWMKNPAFKELAAEARERRKDFIESALDVGAATLTSQHNGVVVAEKPYIRVDDTVDALQRNLMH